jgi:adenosylcobinamide kinase/adenosylcobinamide-phosphate guanylyltransferase
VVTSEIGMGTHPTTEAARKFVELQGFMNQHIARLADEVILMVSGIPLTVKGG